MMKYAHEAWSISNDKLNLKPAFERKSHNGEIQVCIGIATYKRADKLIRCLKSVSKQKSRPFKVIVSNNDPANDISEVLKIGFSDCFSELVVYQQPENLGSLKNFNFLLRKAGTKYFMWLADDDEISETWVEDLAQMLDEDNSLAGVMGIWVCGNSQETMSIHSQIQHSNKNTFLRLLKFVWSSDDAFFYGLFRREILLRGNYPGYFWPNNEIITNWCYIFLISILFHGRIGYSNTCTWYNHDYGDKFYPSTRQNRLKLINAFRAAIRRINVYLLYVSELGRFNVVIAVCIIPILILALLRDAFLPRYLARRFRVLIVGFRRHN